MWMVVSYAMFNRNRLCLAAPFTKNALARDLLVVISYAGKSYHTSLKLKTKVRK